MEHKKSGYQTREQDRRLPALGLAVLLGALGGSLLCARWPWLQTALSDRGQASRVLWQALWPDVVLLGLMLLIMFNDVIRIVKT